MKLTKTQQELYDAMKNGTICIYMPYAGRFRPNAYYFRTDTHQRVTAASKALLKKGLVERYDEKPYGDHRIRIKP